MKPLPAWPFPAAEGNKRFRAEAFTAAVSWLLQEPRSAVKREAALGFKAGFETEALRSSKLL